VSTDASGKRRTHRLLTKHRDESGVIVYGNMVPSRTSPLPSDGYSIVGLRVDGGDVQLFVSHLDWRPQWSSIPAGRHDLEFVGDRGQLLFSETIELERPDSVVAVTYDAPYRFRRRPPRWRLEAVR
jgi:hypothetical protein